MFTDTKFLKSIISFIIVLYIVVCILGAVLNYFYKNISQIRNSATISSEYTNLNLYFLKITKTNDVRIKSHGLVDNNDTSSYFITFENDDGSTNTFLKKGNIIYLNQTKLCENVEEFKIIVDKTTKTSISVEVRILDKSYISRYVLG